MSSSIPRSRKISTVRWLVMWARGVLAVQRYLVTTRCSTPSVARVRAAVAPAGPVPTTSTSVWIVSVIGPLLSSAYNLSYAVPAPQAGNNPAHTLGPVGKDNA